MPYLNNIPQPGDFLAASQPQLLGNFAQLDTSFGVDHYPFSNNSASLGFHNQVTTPAILAGADPATAANPIFYAITPPGSNLPLTQYSRGPNNAVPTPLTTLQSPATALTLANNATTNVFDFAGLTRAYAIAYGVDLDNPAALGIAFVLWDGTRLVIKNYFTTTGITFVNNVSVLQLQNTFGTNFTQLFWTLQFLRTS